jgi:hypothetical protein
MSNVTCIMRWSFLAGLFVAAACKSLDVPDLNDPDRKRVLNDATSATSVAAGTLQSWFNVTQAMDPDGALTTMADNYTASWNNYQMRLYSSEPRTSWQNDAASAARIEIEAYWYGYYAALSSANDVLGVLRADTMFKGNSDSAMVENLAVLMQGMTVAQLALNYDQGFVVDWNTDLLQPLPLSTRAQMRDWALAKLDTAAALAAANVYTWPKAWTGGAECGGGEPRAHAGSPCTNVQVGQLANTMAARLIAYFPRAASEAQTPADWDRVRGYASKGISSGVPSGVAFDFGFVGDGCVTGGKFCDELRAWSNDLTSMRTDTRVAHMMDTSQHTPWPDPNGNPQPNSPDKRLGDGTYDRNSGFCDPQVNMTICPATANAGTDYAYSPKAIFRPARGQYHQSNVGQIRYDYVGFSDPGGTGGGFGFSPVILAAENDLLWAEALIRGTAPDLATAATLINKTRVTRGGLPAATAADGVAGLLAELQYEQDVELAGDNATPYYNRRRIDGLQALTPHQMPIPAKELGVLGMPLYTFGGSAPAFSPSVGGGVTQAANGLFNVEHLMREAPSIWHEIQDRQMARIKAVRQ